MKLPSLIGKLSLAILIFAAVPAAPAQELVTNGGFETGTFAGWTVNDPSGFTLIGDDEVFAHTGLYNANLGATPGVGILSQSLSTTPGTMYTLSFALANDGPAPNFFEVRFDGNIVFSITNSAVFNPGFAYQEFTFSNLNTVASGTTALLEFRHSHSNDFFRLDTVSVVPEPSTISLLGVAAVGGLLALRRSRRKA